MTKIIIEKVFSPLNKMDYSKLKIDDESLMYVTNYKDSKIITDIICDHLKIFKNPLESIIVDATGGIGGDTISFAKYFQTVISIEYDTHRYEFLKNNINVYKLENVVDYNDNCVKIIPTLGVYDVLYIDPPWGGRDYKKKRNLHLTIGDIAIEDFIKEQMFGTPYISVCKLPKNYDLEFLYNKLKGDNINIYLYELTKMYIVLIEKIKK